MFTAQSSSQDQEIPVKVNQVSVIGGDVNPAWGFYNGLISLAGGSQGSHSTKVEAVVRTLKKIQVSDPGAKCLVFSTVTGNDPCSETYADDKKSHPLSLLCSCAVAERPGHHRQGPVRQQHGVLSDQRHSQISGIY